VSAKPPTVVDLTWMDRLQFSARVSKTEFIIDSSGAAGPSPVEALGVALAGCMTIDVAHSLTRGRHPFRALRSKLTAERTPVEPHRFLSVVLHFVIEGEVAADAMHRAIALSREKYCSVWHSLRQDIDFQVTFELAD
jgi:putative redox protein